MSEANKLIPLNDSVKLGDIRRPNPGSVAMTEKDTPFLLWGPAEPGGFGELEAFRALGPRCQAHIALRTGTAGAAGWRSSQ